MNKVFFIVIHILAIAAFIVGYSPFALALCLAFYLIRMFAITGCFHRLMSHRTYQTSRWFQFVLAFIGTCAAQKGPLWWAAAHRHHHKHADTEEDIHSPGIKGIWWAHAGWVLSEEHDEADLKLVKDLSVYPELNWLDKYHYVPPLMYMVGCYLLGLIVENYFPGLHTTAFQCLFWGCFLSTVLLYHGVFCINSFTHLVGKRRFNTSDESRNSFFLSIITLGEGWHNNHHRYPGSERQGFYWWEMDITHYVLVIFSKLGLVWNLRTPPERIYQEALENKRNR